MRLNGPMIMAAGLGFSVTMQVVIVLAFHRLGLTQAGLGAQASEVFLAYVALGQVPIYLGPMVWQAVKRKWDQSRPA